MAQQASEDLALEASDTAEDTHPTTPEEIIVTGVLQTNRQDMLSAVGVLSTEDLANAVRPSIGETLAHLPGVSASSFGPTASRPILRGLQGERVSVLSNGLGSIDVSNTSADHATAVDPLLAERIEVLRGPQALLYSPSVVGGVVNVIDRRIPMHVPDEPVHFAGDLDYASAANQRAASGTVDVPLGDKWVVHADGSYSKSDDLEIGGFALTPALRQQALASTTATSDPLFAENAGVRGILPNTASRTWSAGAGLAFIDDGGSLGVSYSHHETLYGVPLRFATQPDEEQEDPRISLSQDRVDVRAEVTPESGFFDKIRLRWAYADYAHFELEESGEIGTSFLNKGQEGRLELTQARRGNWSGASGAQYSFRDFNVIGDEAFLPKNSTRTFGLFTVQQLDLGMIKLEAGARYGHQNVSAQPALEQTEFFDGSRSFDTFSGSIGGTWNFAGDWRIGVNVARTGRAPSAEELFANGPHAGTQSFEIGNPDFRVEKATSVEAILRGGGDRYTVEASAYYTWFSDYIYQRQTGDIEDGLPVYEGVQGDARYYGFELQGTLTLASIGEMDIVADGLVDYTHATILDYGPAPRIPPLRALGGIGLESRMIDARAEVEWVDSQTRTAPLETSTDGYTMVNAELTWRPWGEDRPLSFALSANNIFDVVARRASSILKDYAPLAGRDFRISARFNF
ncbi:TonB-dependent receptor [Erythrobacter mangrovi]|uniref:TonB-dependent receptor n=1 Tax=Erythrobacter mangrovi TaxID=2739433 RepID=A0A7D4C2Y3_9SPHN|nr:TonB-dependent receptor [Erythrobacter mangrovi]QKG70625.1 TonB-dependent receptor [Erythrobacter mangrovi]